MYQKPTPFDQAMSQRFHIASRNRYKVALIFLTLGFIVGVYLVSYYQTFLRETAVVTWMNGVSGQRNLHKTVSRSTVHLAMVVCDGTWRVEEALTLLKSSTLLTRVPIHVHMFVDSIAKPKIRNELDQWPERIRRKFGYTFYPVQYPPGLNVTEWRTLFKPCATFRLFFPDLLKDVDSVLYMDTDTLFLRPVDDLWSMFNKFNYSQIAAFAPNSEGPGESWYRITAKTPYVPPLGINSGVMLMNLTRMREQNWVKVILDYYEKYKTKIILGDQDLINIYFYFQSDKYFLFSCNWNYRPDHCMHKDQGTICKPVLSQGVSILHANRAYFHYDAEAMFRAVYDSIREYRFEETLYDNLLPGVKRKISSYRKTRCSNQSYALTMEFEKQINLYLRECLLAGHNTRLTKAYKLVST